MARTKRKWPVIAGVIVIGGLFAAMILSTLSTPKYHVEVCMAFNGGTVCRNAAAETKQDAQRKATDLACSDLGAGGFSPCPNLNPVSVKWKQ